MLFVVVSDRVVVAASVVDAGAIVEDDWGGCGSQYCCCISSFRGFNRVVVAASVVDDGAILRMVERLLWKSILLLHQ